MTEQRINTRINISVDSQKRTRPWLLSIIPIVSTNKKVALASGPSGTAVEAAEVVLLWQNSWRRYRRFR